MYGTNTFFLHFGTKVNECYVVVKVMVKVNAKVPNAHFYCILQLVPNARMTSRHVTEVSCS